MPKKEKDFPKVVARVSRDPETSWVDTRSKFISQLMEINAQFPFYFYEAIDNLFLTDPYCAKYLASTVSLGNSGHRLDIDADSEARATEAVKVANDLAARCYPFGGGMDGGVNGLLSQGARAGGMCAEWIPSPTLSQIDELVLVPIKTCRFRYTPEFKMELCQVQNSGLVPLNPTQTTFHAIFSRDNNPYPIPPALVALESAAHHKKITASIRDWMDKLSALGVLIAELEPPPRDTRLTQKEYDAECEVYLDKVASTIVQNFKSGVGIGYSNLKFQFNNTSAGAQGAKDILQIVLQGLFAALQRDPIFFGWSFSSSDTFARVVYEEMRQGIKMFQLGVKRVVEHGHRLNLALSGLGDVGISVKFNDMGSLDAFRDAQAEQMRATAIVTQYQSQIITLEEARKALGYSDISASSGAFVASFNQGAKIYELRPYKRRAWTGFDASPLSLPIAENGESLTM